jgi:Skp family chaperone for outer membrane proteins
MNRLLVAALALVAFVSVAFRPCEGPKVAIVDMSTLVSKHKQSQADQNFIQQWKEASQKKLEEMDRNYKEQVGAREQLKPDSDDYRARTKELKLLKFKLDQEAQALNDEFEARVARSLSEAHARVVAACKGYLESHDLDLIVQHESSPVRGNTSSAVIPEIVVRTVVAYRGTLDITDGVLAVLDAAK